ncbi:hypothetical protein LZ3411_0757 [Levilactobacillus zymae]|uniref:Uncharacterized protein n=1 Tax=Levilactobacillus zymae TaxID=267363 RepID=A0A1Y6JV24_9LACO|nr:hypothetical protein LZ3411_0757 [Levilactobacillus zymae]
MKHPGMYYVYYTCGWLFIAIMLVAIYHLGIVWISASHM